MAQATTESAFLMALTADSTAALGDATEEILRFPFRVGRESRDYTQNLFGSDDRRRNAAEPNNELYLNDIGRRAFVSREHFEIRRAEKGFRFVDRKSAFGTWVEGTFVGGERRGGEVPLDDGDVIILASSDGFVAFKFRIGHP